MNETSDVVREIAALRERVRGAPIATNAELDALQKAIANLNANWYISATLPPPAPGAPLAWRAVYWAKRIIRRVMVALLNNIVQQQNAFNRQVALALTELGMRDAKLIELEKRIAELEEERGVKREARRVERGVE